jgi:hypothetical protein
MEEENQNPDEANNEWYQQILSLIGSTPAEASAMPAKAIRETTAPVAPAPATKAPAFNPNDPALTAMLQGLGKPKAQPGAFPFAATTAQPKAVSPLQAAAGKLKQSKTPQKATPKVAAPTPAPTTGNQAATYPVANPKFSGTSTSGESTTTKTEDPTQVLGKISELSEAQKNLLSTKIPPYKEFLTDVEQKQKERFGNTERAYNAYHGELDKSTRGQFWQDMIHSLGQIVAGGAAYASEKPVMNYYKPIKIFDKQAVDANAKARMEMTTNLAKQRFDDAVQSLQARRDLSVEEKSIAYAAEVDKLKNAVSVLKTTIPTTQEETKGAQGIVDIPRDRIAAAKSGGGPKPPQYVEQKEPTYPTEAAKTNTGYLSKMSPYMNNPVMAGSPEDQAKSYANPRSVRGAFPSVALEKLYLYAYNKSGDKSPQAITKAANELLTRHLAQAPEASTKEAYLLAKEREALQKAGVTVFWAIPQVMMRTKDGVSEYDAANPLDARNPHAYINKVNAAKTQIQSQGK